MVRPRSKPNADQRLDSTWVPRVRAQCVNGDHRALVAPALGIVEATRHLCRHTAGSLCVLLLAACVSGPVSRGGPVVSRDPTLREPPVSSSAVSPATAQRAQVRIDVAATHQVIEGFGATHIEGFDLKTGTDLMGAIRPRVIELVYGQIGISMGHIEVSPYENFDVERWSTANDDDDPGHFNWPAFNFVRSDRQMAGIVEPARAYGFDNFSIHGGTNVRWADPWLADLRRTNYRRYLDEVAENVVAPLVYWRDRFGVVPRWHHLFNEPTSGNSEMGGASVQEIVDVVKAVGARLAREGFASMRLAVASEENEEASLATARAVLADPVARRYVGAIGFHTYPYGSIYSEVRRILETSGAGRPDPERLRVRQALRELCQEHGVQLWMTEVSNGRAGPLDSMRGRAIHIHDEIRYAGVSSYWAMFQAWDTYTPRGACDEDCLVHFDRVRERASISGTGYAIGHFARWVKRGAWVVDAQSDDELVQVSAFRDDRAGRLVAVVVNNDRASRALALTVRGRGLAGEVTGEQSSAEGYWLTLNGAALAPDGGIAVVVPGRSVTSISVALR